MGRRAHPCRSRPCGDRQQRSRARHPAECGREEVMAVRRQSRVGRSQRVLISLLIIACHHGVDSESYLREIIDRLSGSCASCFPRTGPPPRKLAKPPAWHRQSPNHIRHSRHVDQTLPLPAHTPGRAHYWPPAFGGPNAFPPPPHSKTVIPRAAIFRGAARARPCHRPRTGPICLLVFHPKVDGKLQNVHFYRNHEASECPGARTISGRALGAAVTLGGAGQTISLA
jgi:hypothetical protein